MRSVIAMSRSRERSVAGSEAIQVFVFRNMPKHLDPRFGGLRRHGPAALAMTKGNPRGMTEIGQ